MQLSQLLKTCSVEQLRAIVAYQTAVDERGHGVGIDVLESILKIRDQFTGFFDSDSDSVPVISPSMPSTLEISIEPRHYQQAEDFANNQKCPLGIALKERFPNSIVRVYTDFAEIDCFNYKFGDEKWGSYSRGFDRLSIDQIQDYIEMAKDDRIDQVPTFYLTLTRVK